MKKCFILILLLCLSACVFSNKGELLYKTYEHYKDVPIYCLGRCLLHTDDILYINDDEEYTNDNERVVEYIANTDKQYFEDKNGCMVIKDASELQLGTKCVSYTNADWADPNIEYRVIDRIWSTIPLLEVTDGKKNWYITLEEMIPNIYELNLEDTDLGRDVFNRKKFFSEWGTKEEAEEFNKLYVKKRQKKENEYKKELNKKRQEVEAMRNKIAKDSGYDWCRTHDFDEKNCLQKFDGTGWVVLQQTKDGTLIQDYYGRDVTVLIERNKVDSELVDGERVPSGIVANIGIYQYINTLGSTRTIRRFKRIK